MCSVYLGDSTRHERLSGGDRRSLDSYVVVKIVWRLTNQACGIWKPRTWPVGYSDKKLNFVLAKITSDSQEEYVPNKARSANHGPLRLALAKYEEDGVTWGWWRSERLFTTLPEAKDYAVAFLSAHTEWLPPKLRAH